MEQKLNYFGLCGRLWFLSGIERHENYGYMVRGAVMLYPGHGKHVARVSEQPIGFICAGHKAFVLHQLASVGQGIALEGVILAGLTGEEGYGKGVDLLAESFVLIGPGKAELTSGVPDFL